LIKENATVLTHSRSSTVVATFRAALERGRKFHVIATESRPLLEGRRLAHELASEGAAVTLIADAAVALVIDQIDFVLVGADRITPRHLVNKIGTRMIALAAAENNIPVYALADATKFINIAADEESRDPDELWADAPAGIRIINRYFEPAPLDLFTRIITEDGALEIKEARRRAEESLLHPSIIAILDRQPEATR
ncbi:MAG TPA: translation initiation factor eIF-2B, partial [Blastocatellia bacterium]